MRTIVGCVAWRKPADCRIAAGRRASLGNSAAAAPAPAGGTAETRGDGFPRPGRFGGRALFLLAKSLMESTRSRASGHYGTLGVPPDASQRQIERAFRGWEDRRRQGAVSVDDYRRAESAYQILSVPDSRMRHDRQLGLVDHPAWATGRAVVARKCLRHALRELDQGRPGRAVPLLERAVSLCPEDPQARSYLALAIARTGGCLHDADRHGRFAVERRPREAAFLFNLAEVYGAAGLRARAWVLRARAWRAVAASLMGRARGM